MAKEAKEPAAASSASVVAQIVEHAKGKIAKATEGYVAGNTAPPEMVAAAVREGRDHYQSELNAAIAAEVMAGL
jgi:hypothetical protein